ncbi:hypothetical protein BJY04DRAFT_70219 [Aspergillus karnatakaensis]|uniref:uncharacterized protein n=1 Tax=Aspergillus karnatakaensis TaxID=1810916 RepID=UPI003CCD5B04
MNGKTEVAILLANNGANCAALIRDEPAWQWLVKQGLLKSAEFLLELLNKDLLSKHEAPNRISLYICHNKEWELIHDKVAAIEKYKSQHLNALDITVLDENWQPCTMGSLASVVSSQYCAVAYFYEFDLQSQEPLRTDIDPPEALSCIMDCFPDIGIPEGVVEEAAANGNWGLRLLHTLLDVRPEEVEVTEAAIKAMRRGGVARGGILHRLFDGRARLRITSGLLEQLAAVDEPFPLARVIHSYRDTAKVTEQVIKAAAENQYMVSIMLAKLLDYREEEVKITEEIITAAAENPSGATEALGFLLNRVPGEIKVTEKVLKAAAGNIKGKEVLTLLLDRRPHEVKITEEVVEAAAGNPSASAAREILTLLLEQRPDEMKFIEGVAEAAEAGLMSEEVLSLLLDFRTEPEDTGDSA